MNQTKTSNLKAVLTCWCLGILAFSCAPQKQGVRAQVKTEQTNLNPATSTTADQQAQAQNAIYKINTVSLPVETNGGVVINSELLTPNSQYMPISTSHENGTLNSQGVFNDTARGLQVFVNARCDNASCDKYLLLVTVVRNNQAVYQSGALSYKDDCNFYSIAVGNSTGSMFQSMDAFANSSYANRASAGDCKQ